MEKRQAEVRDIFCRGFAKNKPLAKQRWQTDPPAMTSWYYGTQKIHGIYFLKSSSLEASTLDSNFPVFIHNSKVWPGLWQVWCPCLRIWQCPCSLELLDRLTRTTLVRPSILFCPVDFEPNHPFLDQLDLGHNHRACSQAVAKEASLTTRMTRAGTFSLGDRLRWGAQQMRCQLGWPCLRMLRYLFIYPSIISSIYLLYLFIYSIC